MARAQWRHVALIVLFCGFIGAFALLYIVLPQRDFSEKEKRVLAAKPELTAKALLDGSYESGLEDWLSDHVPLREQLVGLNARFELYSGRNGLGGVIRDREGRLLAAPAAMRADDVRKKCGRVSALAENTGLPTTLMLIPESGYMRRDSLPALHDEYPDAEAARLVAESLEGVDFIWPEARYAELADEALYYRTDHHFTSRGAYEACRLYARSLGLRMPSESGYVVQTHEGFQGSQYAKSGLWGTPAEPIELWRGPAELKVRVEFDDREPSDSMFFEAHLADMDKYPVFLDGNHARVDITTGGAGERLLIVRDSFGHCFAPFAADCFSRIVLVDLRYYHKKLTQLVKEEHIDRILVLYGMDTFLTDSNFGWMK